MSRPLCPLAVALCQLAVFTAAAPSSAAEKTCQPITTTEQNELLTFIHQQFGFVEKTELELDQISEMPDSCYKRIRVKVKGSKQRLAQDFYLSPDHRFLSLITYDLQLESAAGRR